MEIGQQSNPPVQCRLCGNYGDHRFEIFDVLSWDTSSSLSEKIFRCLDIEVNSSDPTTVICAECFNKLFDYDQFREVCHATNRKIKNSLSRHHNRVDNGAIFISNVNHEAVVEPVLLHESLVDSVSEPNGEADEMAISVNETIKIERSEDDSDAETVEFALDASENESATDADSGGNERVNIKRQRIDDLSSVTHGSDPQTETDKDADGVDRVVRVSRMQALQKVRPSIPKVTVKKERQVNKKAGQHKNSVHTQAVRFICPNRDCRKIYISKCRLTVHINRIHKNQVAFECPKCSEAFFREHLLKKHLAIVHGDGIAFVCDLCQKSFTTKEHLKKHIAYYHTKMTLYECPEATCSKSFPQKSSMKKHFIGVHSQTKKYKCTKCSAEFSWSGSLRYHLLAKH